MTDEQKRKNADEIYEVSLVVNSWRRVLISLEQEEKIGCVATSDWRNMNNIHVIVYYISIIL